MSTRNLFCIVWLGLLIVAQSAWVAHARDFAGGEGTAVNPFQIASAKQLVALSADPNLWDKHFILIRDIDMASVEPNAFNPIGGTGRFVGVFDGKRHVIAHLRIAWALDTPVGLFGEIGNALASSPEGWAGHVRNLHLRDIHIRGKNLVGGLAGELGSGTIENCSVTGVVIGAEGVGGLVGWSFGEIVSCSAVVKVQGEQRVGGLVGQAWYKAIIASCGVTAEVHGTESVGGLVGDTAGAVRQCSSSGRVLGRQAVGGLIGIWPGSFYTGGIRTESSPPVGEPEKVTQCCSDCSVQGVQEVGGLIGANWGIGQTEDCYALGPVEGSEKVGGLVGLTRGCCVVRCFAAGNVKGSQYTGALIGKSEPVADANGLEKYPPCEYVAERIPESTSSQAARDAERRWRIVYRPAILSCFWDMETSTVVQPFGSGTDSEGITRLTTDQMRQLALFRNAGWDFEQVWTMREDKPYPRLRWEQIRR
jgi:hypothetical protein